MIEGNRSFVQGKKTKTGVVRQFNDLVFSRRLGSTLEMRGFAGNGFIQHLNEVGFADIKVHGEDGSSPRYPVTGAEDYCPSAGTPGA